MYGVPSGIVWDPAAETENPEAPVEEGFLVAAADIALAMPSRAAAGAITGLLEQICVAPAAGEPVQLLDSARMVAGRGLEGDRHLEGRGTFPSGVSGSALTLIQAEVCESFTPALEPNEHRRNLVTRGVELGALVGREFTIGAVRCQGMRLCEPCTVIDRYSSRPLLRPLVHRGGLRADILGDGEIRLGGEIRSDPRRSSARDQVPAPGAVRACSSEISWRGEPR